MKNSKQNGSNCFDDQEPTSSKRKASSNDENSKAKRSRPEGTSHVQENVVQAHTIGDSVTQNVSECFLDKIQLPAQGIKDSEHGDIFQLNLLMLCLWRAAHTKENGQAKYEKFRLATEMPEAYCFDDIAFQYFVKTLGIWKFRLIQAKHKDETTSNKQEITMGDLLSANNNEAFSLQKYFRSFFKIMQRSQYEENSIYSVFTNSEIEDVVVITNKDFDSAVKRSIVFQDAGNITDDPLFKTSKDDTRVCKLDVEAEQNTLVIDKLKVIFENTSDFYVLAETLADHICNNKQIDKNTAIFKEYYYPFVNVFSIFKTTTLKDKKPKYFISLNKFIDNVDLNEEASNLRCAVMKEIAFRKGSIAIPNVDSNFGRNNKTLPDDGSLISVTMDAEAQGDDKKQLSNTGERQLAKLAKKLAGFIRKNKPLTVESFKDYHVGLAYEVIDKKSKKFKNIFINGQVKTSSFTKELSSAAKKLRRNLIDEMYNKDIKIKVADKENTFKEFESEFSRDLISISEIRVSKGFGTTFSSDMDPKIKNVGSFANQIVTLLFNDQSVKDRVIKLNEDVKTTLQKVSKKDFNNFNTNMRKLAGYVLISRFNKIRFSSAFLKSKNLPGNLNEFRAELEKLLIDKYPSLHEYEVKFDKKFGQTFKTCEDGELDKKLPIVHNDADVINFLKMLKFVVKFPDRKGISRLLGEEIRSELKSLDEKAFESLYYKKIHNWIADRVGTFYTAEKAEALCTDIKDYLSFLTADGINDSYFSYASQYKFKEYSHLCTFLSGYEKVLHLIFEDLALGRSRIIQTFKDLMQQDSSDIQNYTRGFGHIFFTLDQFSDADFRSNIFKMLATEQKFGLIVIEGNSSSINKKLLKDLSSALRKAVKNSCLPDNKKIKKVIFITTDSNDALANRLKRKSKTKVGPTFDNTSVDDIADTETKKCLLRKRSIIFQKQGEKISFSKLLGIDVDDYLKRNEANLKNIISTEILVALINGEKINIGHALPMYHGYDKDYYIDRKFNSVVILDEGKIKKAIEEKSRVLASDFFVICGSGSMLIKDNIKVFDENGVEGLRELNSQPNIHWLRMNSGKLIWTRSDGCISNLVNFRKVEDISAIKENKVLIDEDQFLGDDIMIIADAAGSGKSTVMTNLSLKLKEKNPNMWVIRIDLNYHSDELLKELKSRRSGNPSFSQSDKISALEFLCQKVLSAREELKFTNKVEEHLFKTNLNHKEKKITLIFDGFDEISPTFKDIVIKLLHAMNSFEGVKLIVTTRPNMRSVVECELDKFSCILHPFSEKQQIKLLTKFWTKKLGLNKSNEEQKERLLIYAKDLRSKFLSAIASRTLDNHQFTAIPLHAKMLAEIFLRKQNPQETWQGCEEYLNAEGDEPPQFPEVFDLSDLYARFVDTKFRSIHFEEKKERKPSKIGEESKLVKDCKKLEKIHEILALSTVFSEDDLEGLFSPKTLERRKEWMKEIEPVDENAGIISEIVNEKPHFIHFTFSEYFIANFFGKRKSEQSGKVLQKLILTNILMKSDYKIVRLFLYEYMEKNQLNEEVWSEGMLKLLELAYSYDGRTENQNLFETIVESLEYPSGEPDDIRLLCDVFIHEGFKDILDELIIPQLAIAFPECELHGVIPVLCEFIDNEKLVRLMRKHCLLEHLAFCRSDTDAFLDFEEFVLTRHFTSLQLEFLFDDHHIYENFIRGNLLFIQMMERVLDRSLLHRILSKHAGDLSYFLDSGWNRRFIPDEEEEEYKRQIQLIWDACASPTPPLE